MDKIKKNWARPENFDICYCVSFNRSNQGSIFVGEARQWSASTPRFEIFISFSNFLKFQVFVILDIKLHFTCGEQEYYVTDFRGTLIATSFT